MKKQVLIPTLIIGALLTGSLALAGPGFGGGDCNGKGRGQDTMTYGQHEERMERRLEMMNAVLDLTEDQQEQIEALFNKKWQDKQSQREEMQAARDAMREVRTADTFDEADFRVRADTFADLKIELMVDRQKAKQEIYAIMTPEQQEKADKLGGMMGGKGHKGGRHGFSI